MIQRLATCRSIRQLSNGQESFAIRWASRAAAVSSLPSAQLHIPSRGSSPLPRPPPPRRFSSSHDDFSPKKKHDLEGDDNESAVMNLIDSHVKQNRIMLYMKGSPNQPMCGFSAKVVGILKKSGADFASVNVLDYPEMREGVKKYAQWPTIPQLYVDGEFLGGCDIVKDLDESGELAELLKVPEKEGEGK